MKIYTYYEDIKFRNQEKLIDVWESSWKNKGFDPVVLTRSDAEKNSLFSEFQDKMQKLHTEIMGKPVMGYGMSCYYRWLAYGALNDRDAFYVSDYDVINRSWSPIEPLNRLHLLDEDCPCLASGTTEQMQRLCELFPSVTESRLGYLKSKRNSPTMPWYHDQEFFTYNFTLPHNPQVSRLKIKEKVILTRDKGWIAGGKYDPKHKSESDLLHISHFCVEKFIERNQEYKECNIDNLRVELAREYMKDS